MSKCKWLNNEFCVNSYCPMRADYCPVPDYPGVCRFEERMDEDEAKKIKMAIEMIDEYLQEPNSIAADWVMVLKLCRENLWERVKTYGND